MCEIIIAFYRCGHEDVRKALVCWKELRSFQDKECCADSGSERTAGTALMVLISEQLSGWHDLFMF